MKCKKFFSFAAIAVMLASFAAGPAAAADYSSWPEDDIRIIYYTKAGSGGDLFLRQLAAALHPTPAVCGLPKTEALTRILTTESLDRRYYAGFLGWWGQDEAALYVNLRCLKLYAGGVRLYAGGGILPESTLEQEWQETCHKMCTMLVLLGRQDEACPADNQPA